MRETSPENRVDTEAKLIFPARRCKYLYVDGPLQSSRSDDEDHNVIVFAGTRRNSFSRLLRFLHTSATLYILRLESISRCMSSRFLTSPYNSLSCVSGKAPSADLFDRFSETGILLIRSHINMMTKLESSIRQD
jgi:hypothetical protein